MRAIAQQYVTDYGDAAVATLVFDLMKGDPATLKAGYSRDNAIIAASEVFDLSRDEIEAKLTEAGS